MECLSPNIHVPDLTAGPKKKRFQVHSACTQCKKSHAACSMTRPCERCVRVGESHLCVDVPRKRRGKQPQGTQVINGLTIHPVPLDPSPSIPSNTNNNNNNNNATTEDGSPIDELSDFLFDGIENNLLTDSNLRNMALLEGSSLSVNTLLNTRPLFANSNSSYSISPYISTLSPQTSSSDVSPVPSPYNANSSNDSPSHEINYSNPLNYTSNYLSPNGESTNPNSYTTHINNNLYTNLSNQAYSTSNTYPTPTFDTESINDHINNLLSGHIPVSSTSSSSELSSSTSTSTSTATAVITPINLPLSPQTSSTSNSSTSHQWPENTSPLQSVPDIVTYDIPVNNNNIIPTNTGIVDRLATYENPNQEEIPNGNSDDFKKIDSFIPKCFCHQVHRPGKVQLVCVHEKPQPGGAVSKCESVEPVNTQTSLHLVVESLVREVQNLKRELRGEQPPRSLSCRQLGEITSLDQLPTGPAVAVWDLISQKLTECNDTFATLFNVDRTQPCYLTDIAQCPAYFLRLCSNKTTWHEKRRYSLKRPEGDITLVVAVDINGTCVVTTFWKA